jgi:hypothetical protein
LEWETAERWPGLQKIPDSGFQHLTKTSLSVQAIEPSCLDHSQELFARIDFLPEAASTISIQFKCKGK